MTAADRHARYRAKNPEKVKAWRADRVKRGSDLCNAAKDRPCADCGGVFHYSAMDFDHRGQRGIPSDTKMKQLAIMSASRFADEVAKCDVVCANCHRVRTWKRRQK